MIYFYLLLILMLLASLCFGIIRSVKGPTLIDRAAALDIITASIVAIYIVFSMFQTEIRLFLDIMLIMLGTGFLSSLFLSKAYEKSISLEDSK